MLACRQLRSQGRKTSARFWAWFKKVSGVKKVSGTVAGTARRVLRTTVPDTFLNQRTETSLLNGVAKERSGPKIAAVAEPFRHHAADQAIGGKETEM